MPAPKGNTNAERVGYAALIRIRVQSEEDFNLIIGSLNTDERGMVLLNYALEMDMNKKASHEIVIYDKGSGEHMGTIVLDRLEDARQFVEKWVEENWWPSTGDPTLRWQDDIEYEVS